MTKSEVVHFMQKIKAYYPFFTLEEWKINEWYDKLKLYSLNDVYWKFDQHLEGELKDQAPLLHYITKFLKTEEEKKQNPTNEYYIRCNLCNKPMSVTDYEKHYDKCLSVTYLISMMKHSGINTTYEIINSLSDEKFEELYNKYRKYEDKDEV